METGTPQTQTTLSSDSYEDQLAAKIREGIIKTLQPFLTLDEGMATMIRHMLLRALERASLENLFDVLRSAEYFVVTMKGEMEIYVRSLDIGDIDTSSGENDGPGSDSGESSIREVDTASGDNNSILETLPGEVQSISDRYEAEMESDEDGNWTISTNTL